MMFGCDRNNRFWLFIHIPRTGGTALTKCYGNLPAVSKLVHFNKHAPVTKAKSLLRGSFNQAYKFCVMRDPVDIVASWYCHCLDYESFLYCTNGWKNYCQRVQSISFSQFIQQEMQSICGFGGFKQHYCKNIQVDVLNFQQAVAKFNELCDVNLVPQRINSSLSKVEIKEEDREAIRRWCWGDYENTVY